MKVTVSQEYENLVLPLSDKQFKLLKDSINENGLWVPIIVNQNGIILDGHHRFMACGQLRTVCNYVVKQFDDKLDEALFVIDCNLQRRHLSGFARGELALRKKPYLKEKAEQREKAGIRIDPSKDLYKGRVDDQVGDSAQLSHISIHRIEVILDEYQKDKEKWQSLLEDCRADNVSIEYAWKMVTRGKDHKDIPELPEGEFDIILADPPWNYDINTRGAPDEHYAVMTNEKIQQLEIPSAENAILFLWATAPKIKEALEVMRCWGFKYKTHAVWVKQHFGTGYYFRGQHELLLVGEKGDMPVPEEANRISSVIVADKTEHSTKPQLVYSIIENMYPNRTYLELFARSKFSDSWTVWGNEIEQIENI